MKVIDILHAQHSVEGQMQQAPTAQQLQHEGSSWAIDTAMNAAVLLGFTDLAEVDVIILLPRTLLMQTKCSSETLRELNSRTTTNRVAAPMITVIPITGS